MAKRIMSNKMIQTKIEFRDEKQIRTLWDTEKKKWYFSVVDFIDVLTETKDAFDYMKKIRKRDRELAHNWKKVISIIPCQTKGGIQDVIFADTKGLMRIIQAIPSRNAEIIKRWIAIRAGAELSALYQDEQNQNAPQVYTDSELEDFSKEIIKIQKTLFESLKKKIEEKEKAKNENLENSNADNAGNTDNTETNNG